MNLKPIAVSETLFNDWLSQLVFFAENDNLDDGGAYSSKLKEHLRHCYVDNSNEDHKSLVDDFIRLRVLKNLEYCDGNLSDENKKEHDTLINSCIKDYYNPYPF